MSNDMKNKISFVGVLSAITILLVGSGVITKRNNERHWQKYLKECSTRHKVIDCKMWYGSNRRSTMLGKGGMRK